MEKKVKIIAVLAVLLVSLFYFGDKFTGLAVNDGSRAQQLQDCVAGGTSLLQCRLNAGILTQAEFEAAGGNAIAGAAVAGLPSQAEYKKMIHTVWRNYKPFIHSWISFSFSDDSTSGKRTRALYDLQGWTNNLLLYASANNDIALLDDLAETYLMPLQYLETKNVYRYAYLPEKLPPQNLPAGEEKQRLWKQFYRTDLQLEKPILMWSRSRDKSMELRLDVGQFLYLASDALNAFLAVPQDQRTPNMQRFIREYPPVIKAHYQRWVIDDHRMFGLQGWGCNEYGSDRYNHLNYLKSLRDETWTPRNKDKPNTLCNSMTDIDTWMVVGVVKMLAANHKDPSAMPLTQEQKTKFMEYVGVGTQAIERRMNPNQLTDFAGKQVVGFNFEQNRGDTHPDNVWSGYEGASYPTENDKSSRKTGWDFSHATRLPYVFDTLYKHKDITGQSFPTQDTMKKVANQYVYGVFNKDLELPLFSNFFSGDNGWFRVNYGWSPKSGKPAPGTGTPPYGQNYAGPSYFMSLAKYTPDKNKLLPAIWNILTTNMVKDKSHNGNLATGWKVTSNPEGKFGGSLVFDHPERYKEYLWCGKHTDWIQSKGTFAFWVKTAEQNVDMDVLDLWEVPYTDIFIVMVNKQNKVWFTVKEANNKLISLTSKKAMDAPGWHHVVITQDGSGAKIYIDGELSETSGKNSAEWTNTLNMHHFPKFNDAYNSAGCYLGNSHWTKFRGELDEVYFLNRALSAEEVQQLHQNTLKNKEGLLIHWSFDDLLDVKKMEHKDLYYGPRDYYNKNPPKLVEQYFPDKSKTMLIALPVFALGSS